MIVFDNVSKEYPGGVLAVSGLSLEVKAGETLVLVGTSGSGKTTTMKMVNRLLDPTGGRILIDGQDIMSRNPIELRRSIGYAIQNVGLFPHLTVGDNVAVVARMIGWPKQRVNDRIDELLTMVGLPSQQYRDRYPSQLSGGQKQRVGVARALSADPPIVLMDEPFGALDPITREQLQSEFIELESKIKKTIVFVTHDIFEAVKMGDRVAVMDQGRLQQLSDPHDLVENPANEFVAEFLGPHRFQLSLLTSTLRTAGELDTVQGPPAASGEPHLRMRDNLVEALDKFKKTDRPVLAVYDGEEFRGRLPKKKLLGLIATCLGEAGETS